MLFDRLVGFIAFAPKYQLIVKGKMRQRLKRVALRNQSINRAYKIRIFAAIEFRKASNDLLPLIAGRAAQQIRHFKELGGNKFGWRVHPWERSSIVFLVHVPLAFTVIDMNLLGTIATWWSAQGDFPREWIANEMWHRVLKESTGGPESAGKLFHDFLREELTAERQLGRALIVRAVIDYYFFRANPNESKNVFLDEVEVGDSETRELANEALARHRTATPAWNMARESWQELRGKVLSDEALQSWERECILGMFRR